MLDVFEDNDRGHLHTITRSTGHPSDSDAHRTPRSQISSLFPLLACRKGQRGCIRILLEGRAANNPLIVDPFTEVFWGILSMLIGEEHAHLLYFLLTGRKAHYIP